MALSVDWDRQIQVWQRSGLSQAAYYRQQGLNYGRVTLRISAYRKQMPDTAASSGLNGTLIPVQIQSPDTHTVPLGHCVIRLKHSECQLELPISTPAG